MLKTKFWLAQLLMLSVIALILGSPAFAKAPEHSKGIEMKNNASDRAKEKANSNAGFESVAEEPVEGPDVGDDTAGDTGEVDPAAVALAAEAKCDELGGSYGPGSYDLVLMDATTFTYSCTTFMDGANHTLVYPF
jgi:hypothetical protein